MMNTLLTFILGKLIELILNKYTDNRKVLAHILNCLSVLALFCVFLGEYGIALDLYYLYIKFVLVLFDIIH